MALFDDKRFLLSHIRHSFITGDDTGICEAVMLNEILPHRNRNDDDYNLLEELMIETRSELENAQSFDIVSNMDVFGSHRRRSNTAQRLERLRVEKKNKAKVKVVQWREVSENLSINDRELDDYFPIKSVQKIREEKQRLMSKKSLLSKQMHKYPTAPVNPFNEYSRYDARISETNGNSKRLTIYLTMLNEEERNKPLVVEVVNNARIQDLIGLICWQYTNMRESKEPLLNSSVSHYCLRIAEENGDVDPDFPCLNANELVSKFGFPILALEERKIEDENTLITVHFENMFTKIEPPSQDITMAYIMEAVITKRKLKTDKQWVLKRVSSLEADYIINPNTKLSELREKEFRLVSLDDLEPKNDLIITDTNEIPDLEAIGATMYKCFNVLALQKYSNAVEVQLGISGKKVDVTPLSSANVKPTSNKFWKIFETKPTSFNIEDIVRCYISKSDSPDDRSLFKISYLNGQTEQSLKFESSSETANKIVNKLNHLMQMTSSNLRKRNEMHLSKMKK